MKIRILLADDHQIVREGFRALLEREPDMEVIGEVDNGRDALEMATRLSPDIVILDISMPGLNGIEAARKIIDKRPATKVLGLSVHSEKRYIAEMLKAGASGYLLKRSSFKELITAIKAIHSGQMYLSPSIAGTVVEHYVRHQDQEQPSGASVLSAREREVLQLVAEGNSTKEIAKNLHVSARTVDAHRQRVMEKLDIHSIAELTRYAIREGITPL